jgi:hypothetical protein
MEKQVAIAIDFGTTSSGSAFGDFRDGKFVGSYFVNADSEDKYAKEPTFLVVNKSILSRLSTITDSDIKNVNNDGALVHFGNSGMDFINNINENPDELKEWVIFDKIKMNLYNDSDKVTGSDDNIYNIVDVIALYIRCLKVTALAYAKKKGYTLADNGDIVWGVTIPAVWNDFAKNKMMHVNEKVWGEDKIRILEPEGAAVSIQRRINGDIVFQKDDTILVVDCGGGTTDIVGFRIISDDGENLSTEEVIKSEGINMAGTNMDEAFWSYFAKCLAQSTSFQSLPNATIHQKLIKDYWNESPLGKIKMQKAWMSIKHHTNFGVNQKIAFNPDNDGSYPRWLRKNYPEIFDKIMEDGKLMFLVELMRFEIVDNVFKPVASKIAELVEKKINEYEKNGFHFDYIFGAGGLMGIDSLRDELQRKVGGNHKLGFVDDVFAENNTVIRGGAIMDGAMYMLVNNIMMRRVAKRYYYIDFLCEVPHAQIEDLVPYFRNLYDCSTEEIKNYLYSQKEYFKPRIIRGKYYAIVLTPICYMDKPYLIHQSTFHPIDDEDDSYCIDVWSSNKHGVFLPGEYVSETSVQNPNVYHEGKINGDYDSTKQINYCIDFNTVAQNSFFMVDFYNSTGKQPSLKIERVEVKLGH